jgi:hypothetical protein
MGLLVLVVIRVTKSESQRDIEQYIRRETHFFDLAIANVVQLYSTLAYTLRLQFPFTATVADHYIAQSHAMYWGTVDTLITHALDNP